MKKEGGGDEIELSLDLSIGGNYGKSESSRYDKVHGPDPDPGPLRSNLSENGCEYPYKRREIQAFRRQEARKKREEKLKRSREVNGEGFGEDGEIRAIEGGLEEPPRKKGVWSDEFTNELSPSSATESKIARQQMEQDCSYRNAQCMLSGNGFTHPFWVPNIGESKKNQGNVCFRLRDGDSEHANSPVKDHGNRTEASRSLERNTSVVSDYQNTSIKGGSSSDTGSHFASRNTQEEQFDGNTSSQTEPCLEQLPDNCTKLLNPSIVPQKSKASYCLNQTNDTRSPSSVTPPPSQHRNSSESEKPIRPPVRGLSTTTLPHMPCVSATGNGPNGKTINGFLYKYTKTEVSIICVCHGSSFSPAEFVEHAGGVDISHPLKHITIVPSCF